MSAIPSTIAAIARSRRFTLRILGLDGVRGVGELAELGCEEVGGLLADVDGAVADALDRASDDDHAQAPLAERGLGHDVDQALDEAAVRPVDQLVQLDEALRPGEI